MKKIIRLSVLFVFTAFSSIILAQGWEKRINLTENDDSRQVHKTASNLYLNFGNVQNNTGGKLLKLLTDDHGNTLSVDTVYSVPYHGYWYVKNTAIGYVTTYDTSFHKVSSNFTSYQAFNSSPYLHAPANITYAYHPIAVSDFCLNADKGITCIGNGLMLNEAWSSIWKIDSMGHVIKRYDFFGAKTDYSMSGNCKMKKVISSSSGDFVVIGALYDTLTGIQTNNFFKLNQNGDTTLIKAYNYFELSDIVEDAGGNFLLIGKHEVIKVNQMGDTLWTKQFPSNIFFGQDLGQDTTNIYQNGKYYLLGAEGPNNYLTDTTILYTIDTSGTIVTHKEWVRGKYFTPVSLYPEGKEFLIVCSYTDSLVWGRDIYYIHTDSLLNSDGRTIEGSTYTDLDKDCIHDNGEKHVQSTLIMATSGSDVYYGITDQHGNYSLNVDSGIYSVSATPLPYSVQLCPANNAAVTADVSNLTMSATGIDIADTLIPGINDLSCSIFYVNPAITGQSAQFGLSVTNKGTSTQNAIVKIKFYSPLIFYSVNPYYSGFSSSDTILININALQPTQSVYFDLNFLIPTTAVAGTPLQLKALVTPAQNDAKPSDNFSFYTQTVVSSYDPNDKYVTPSDDGHTGIIDSLQHLFYRINFQNTGTAPAFNVAIIDTLSANLDLSTFQFLGSKHPCTFFLDNNRALHFVFSNIMLPDSNTNEPASHGWLNYSICTKPGLMPGDEIKNTAYIYFDFNAPIVTGTTINTVSSATGIENNFTSEKDVVVYPNPARNNFTVALTNQHVMRELYLSDLSGKTLMVLKPQSSLVNIDASQLPEGVFFVNVLTKDGGRFVKKLIVIR